MNSSDERSVRNDYSTAAVVCMSGGDAQNLNLRPATRGEAYHRCRRYRGVVAILVGLYPNAEFRALRFTACPDKSSWG